MINPIQTTLIFGLVSSLGVAVVTFCGGTGQSLSLRCLFVVMLLTYGILLCRWSDTRYRNVFIPMAIVTMAALLVSGFAELLLICAALLSLIRSTICFRDVTARTFSAEVISMICGIGLVMIWWPLSMVAFSVAVWLFFLSQALYFVIVPIPDRRDVPVPADSFEYARCELERILRSPLSG